MIKKVKGGYVNETKSGHRMEKKPTSHEKAVANLRAIEYFKHNPRKGK